MDEWVDEVFYDMAVEFCLDDLVERLAAVGIEVLPWQRDVLSAWLDADDLRLPRSVRFFRLVSMLRCARREVAALDALWGAS